MSEKIRPFLEALVGFILVFGYLWFISPLYSKWIQILTLIPIFSFIIYSDFIGDKSSLKDLGFRWDNWFDSFKILFIFTVVAIPVLYLIWQNYFPVNNAFYKSSSFWEKIFTYPLWALFQQYIFLAFFFRRYRKIFSPRAHLAVFFSALTFAMIHIPNPPLVIFCFIAGIVWAYAYNKYPNLFTTAISQAVFGILCSNILLVYPLVGPHADIGRWSKESDQVSVYGYIERVDHIFPYKDGKILEVHINREKQEIFVEGWVASVNQVKEIRIRLGGRDYPVHYGDRRENVAAFFKNPDFLNSGFTATIPVSDFSPGYHRLVLKVYMEGELFHNKPGEKIWVKII
jgi:membrane protease YdiL (CAAX protease family)